MTNTSDHEMTPEDIRHAIHDIKQWVELREEDLAILKRESLGRIAELQGICPHLDLIYCCGTPYDRGHHKCLDCGAEVRKPIAKPKLPSGDILYRALLARSKQIQGGEE
jgi:hypothetical protein